MELSSLGEHLNQCQEQRGPLFALRCMADALDGFLGPRFVTSVIAVALLGVTAAVLV
jgi:hypothetical protein